MAGPRTRENLSSQELDRHEVTLCSGGTCLNAIRVSADEAFPTPSLNVGEDRSVDERIDLDDAAQEIEVRREAWRSAGITVGETTWRDKADGWPWELKTSRSTVQKPDSVGIALSKGKQEGSVVLFRGGWADLLYWNGEEGEVIDEAPGWEDWLTIATYGSLLDRLGGFFA